MKLEIQSIRLYSIYMPCHHYKFSEYCSLCSGEAMRRYQKALLEIVERIRTSDEITADLVEAIERITKAALKN